MTFDSTGGQPAKEQHSPFAHFILSEIWAAAAAAVALVLCFAISYLSGYLAELISVKYKEPFLYLEWMLGWVGVVAATLEFVVISIFQLWVLIKRLGGEL